MRHSLEPLSVADAAIDSVPLLEENGKQSLADIAVGTCEEYFHVFLNKVLPKMLAFIKPKYTIKYLPSPVIIIGVGIAGLSAAQR